MTATALAIYGEGTPRIETYLNPAYWGGAMLGDGSALPPPRLPDKKHHAVRAGVRLAAYLRARPIPYPLDTFRSGDTFDCKDHNPGTVVMYNQEDLVAPHDLSGPIEGYDEQPVPHPPQRLPFRIRRDEELDDPNAVVLRRSGITYSSATLFGVIVNTGRNRHGLFAIPGSAIFASEMSGVSIRVSASIRPTPVIIGETNHYAATANRHERLERVNILAICGIGEPKPVREPERRALLGSLLTPLLRGTS